MCVVLKGLVGVVMRGPVGVVLKGLVGVALRCSVGVVLRGSVDVFTLESGKKQTMTIDSHNKIHVLNTKNHHVCCAFTCKYQTQHSKYICTQCM